MRFLDRWLLKARFLALILAAGAVGGLLAPPSSEAVNATAPTISITATINGTAYGPLELTTTNGRLTLATCPTGYNYCWTIKTFESDSSLFVGTSSRQYRLKKVQGVNPMLQISDNTGSASSSPTDLLKVTGVSLTAACPASSATEPCPSTNWPNSLPSKVKLEVTHTFDAKPNSVGTYLFNINQGGYLSTLAASNTTSSGDKVQIYGKGTFDPTVGQVKMSNNTNNKDADNQDISSDGNVIVNTNACVTGHADKSPLCTVNANGTQVSYGQGQSSPYAGYACNNRNTSSVTVVDFYGQSFSYSDARCTPKMTITHFFTSYGADVMNWTTSMFVGGGVCGDKPLPSCDCADKKSLCAQMDREQAAERKAERDAAKDLQIPELEPCTTANCNVTFAPTINVTTPGLTSGQCTNRLNEQVPCNAYPFLTVGPEVQPFTITVNPATRFGTLLPPLTGLISGDVGAHIFIYPDYDRWPILRDNQGNPVYQEIDQAILTSDLGTTIVGADVLTIACAGGDKTPIVGYRFGVGDTVRAAIHVKGAQSPPAICSIPELAF